MATSSNLPPPPPPPSTSAPYDHLFKVLMIGDAGVGKVCMNDKVNVPFSFLHSFEKQMHTMCV